MTSGYLADGGRFVVPFDKRTVKAALKARCDHVLDRQVEAALIAHCELAG